ncbi:MAG: hypothetical protein ACRCY4_09580 [Brevinema sp.]
MTTEEEKAAKSIQLYNKMQLYLIEHGDLKPDMSSAVGKGYISLGKMKKELIKAIMHVDPAGFFMLDVVEKENKKHAIRMRLHLGGVYVPITHEEDCLGYDDFPEHKNKTTTIMALNSLEQLITCSRTYAQKRCLATVLPLDEHSKTTK